MNAVVLLVGAGNLGSRHLQSLAEAEWIDRVVVVEPNPVARERAVARWSEMPGSAVKELRFHSLADAASLAPYTAAIIATPALGRLSILRQVLALEIKTVLSEKVLFQTRADLVLARDIVEASGADVRVNHVYRYADVFARLRAHLVTLGPQSIDFQVDVGGDGMGSNLVHHLDLFSWFSGAPVAELTIAVDKPVSASKRGSDFVEFTGFCEAQSTQGDRARITYHCGQDTYAPRFRITGRFGHIAIDEGDGSVDTSIAALKGTRFVAPRVSELTAEILRTTRISRCELPSLGETTPLNLQMLSALNKELSGEDDASTVCPVT